MSIPSPADPLTLDIATRGTPGLSREIIEKAKHVLAKQPLCRLQRVP